MPRSARHRPALLVAFATMFGVALGCGTMRRGAMDEAMAGALGSGSCRPGTEPVGGRPLADATPDERIARAEVCAMMDRSAVAWNRGDLEAFMSDYTEDATYVGSSGLARGRTAIGAGYAPRFQSGVARDSLSFSRVEVDLLAPNVAHVLATYVLMRGDSVTSRGPTSLVMRRFGGNWRIAHDHSS